MLGPVRSWGCGGWSDPEKIELKQSHGLLHIDFRWQINFVAVLISNTPHLPYLTAAAMATMFCQFANTVPSSLPATSVLRSLVQPRIYQHLCRLQLQTYFYIKLWLWLWLSHLQLDHPQEAPILGWITILIAAVYFMMSESHVTIKISSATIIEFP